MTDKHTNIIPPAINTPFFEDTEIRRERYNDERWYSIVNIISVLT